MRPDADRCDVGQDAVLHYNKMLEARGAENYVVHYHINFFSDYVSARSGRCKRG